ncbi:MAG: flagellar filament capping protein FliD [Eubacteriales bacterium]|nr:flagellar filament capping protein FliD [Eubacteriales bacterium]
MAIRLSGMVSGMDTESLVAALVSSYSMKKDNLVKAQTKLSWTQEKWKTTNTSIYSFYSGKLSSARLSSAYNLKTSTVSNSNIAKVTASSSAVNGTQKLKVNALASSGYLTGASISSADSSAIKGDTKLSEIFGAGDSVSGGKVSIAVDGRTTNIEITDDMTVNQFVMKLKDAGVNASFDDTNQRFFISSKTSGKDHDFSLVANNSNGLKLLKGLGIYTVNNTDSAEYKKWAEYSDDEITAIKERAYKDAMISETDRAKEHGNEYNAAKSALEELSKYDTWSRDVNGNVDVNATENRLNDLKTDFETKYAAYAKTDSEGNVTYDTEAMDEDTRKAYESDKANIDQLEKNIKDYKTYDNTMSKLVSEDKVVIDSETGKAVTTFDENTAVPAGVTTEVAAENATIKADVEAAIDEKIAFAKTMNGNMGTDTEGAARIIGADAEIELNKAKFTSNTNNFSINGLTIQATALTENGEEVTITTDTDVDGIYNSVKEFFTEYNKLIKSLEEAYNADSSKGYEPLTDDEKEAMSDDEVEKWETKIKDSLLRKDSTLSGIINTMKNDMALSYKYKDKTYSLSSFGISTLGYFASGENEKGVYHIDGDSEDSATKGNADKLRAAIAGDPEAFISFFSQLTTKLYTDLGDKMASSSTSSAYTVYNDKEMKTQYSEYNTKISSAEDKVTTWEDYYYKKFSAMETALSKLNSQTSSLSNMMQ